MELRINRQPALIGLNIAKARLEFQTTPGQVDLETTPGQLDIKSSAPRLHIDQSQCFADKDSKSPAQFAAGQVAEAKSDYMAGLNRRVAEGDQLAQIIGPSIIDIIKSQFNQQKAFNLQCVSVKPPEISCEVYPVEINYQAAVIQNNYRPAYVEYNSQPGKVETYLIQKPFLEISWVG